MSGVNAALTRWFEQKRGIRPETLEAFGVYTDGDDFVVLPYPHGDAKIRKGTLTAEKKTMFWRDKSPKRSLYGQDKVPSGAEVLIVPEGETDTMRLWQAIQDAGLGDRVGVMGLSGMNWWREEFAELFEKADRAYVVLDNDDPYTNPDAKKSADKAWIKMRKDVGSKMFRVSLPGGVKDICEFFDAYDVPGTSAGIEMLQTLCRSSTVVKLNYPPVDMTKEPPEPDWLVQGWIAKPDVVMMFGLPGSMKSWLAMSLAAAVADQEETHWMGFDIKHHGRVVYVDQESPLDGMLSRFAQLGAAGPGCEKVSANMHVLWGQYIDIKGDFEPILADMLVVQPTLIVFDSLSMIHHVNESAPAEMKDVFHSGLIPLARETGAAVVVVHHAGKTESEDPFLQIRGASSIPQLIDFGLSVQLDGGPTQGKVTPYKPKRGQSQDYVKFTVEDYWTEDQRKLTRVEKRYEVEGTI